MDLFQRLETQRADAEKAGGTLAPQAPIAATASAVPSTAAPADKTLQTSLEAK